MSRPNGPKSTVSVRTPPASARPKQTRPSGLNSDPPGPAIPVTAIATAALERASAPHGFNLGMNQGAVAGAGVAAHLHQHVIPRWGGDMNFLPIVAQTKALPILLEDARAALAAAWPDAGS